MTSLTNIHNLGWTWWRNTWSLWRSEQRSNKIMQSSYGKWFEYGGPCSCVQCMLHAHVWTCSVCVRAELWLTVKWMGRVTCLEQNRTCRHLRALVLALDQRISAYSHAGLLVGSVSAKPWRSLDSHAILCVWQLCHTALCSYYTEREGEREEVGADEHMTLGMWIQWKHWHLSVHLHFEFMLGQMPLAVQLSLWPCATVLAQDPVS